MFDAQLNTQLLAWLSQAPGFIVGLAAGYFGTFLSKSGEIHAIGTKLDEVVRQNAAITQTNEAIRASISNDMWLQQRKIQLKTEAAFSGIKAVAALNWALSELLGGFAGTEEFYKTAAPPEARQHAEVARAEMTSLFKNALKRFSEDASVVLIVCGKPVRDKFVATQNILCSAAIAGTRNGVDNAANYKELYKAMEVLNDLTEAIRSDLDL
jgi:hypothetical protein